jgi:hypothetical protein
MRDQVIFKQKIILQGAQISTITIYRNLKHQVSTALALLTTAKTHLILIHPTKGEVFFKQKMILEGCSNLYNYYIGILQQQAGRG